MTMNEETKTVEEVLAEVDERLEEIEQEHEVEVDNRLAKVVKGLETANKAIGIIGFGAVVGMVIKESIKK